MQSCAIRRRLVVSNTAQLARLSQDRYWLANEGSTCCGGTSTETPSKVSPLTIARRGVSLIEFIGCLAALGGGLVIGSIYLGLDVKTMAAVVLEKADIDVPAMLTDKSHASEGLLPSSDASEQRPNAAADSAPKAKTDESQSSQSEQKNGALLQKQQDGAAAVASLSVDPPGLSDTAALRNRQTFTADEQRAATENCWKALTQCVQHEAANRSKTINDSENSHLYDYLLRRQAGHQLVADTIVQLDQHGIDHRLRIHMQQLLAWHRTGAELYERAAQLLTDAPSGKLSGPFAQSWQSAATQHRMEEKLILDKHAAVASYLERSHKLP